eukprot:TRINITY_DN1208_c0_g1_i1.p1 TRINITY_DN1208_c0_g1~~TRINITY_DN1208_c0_g1_i1.p1  ORF type:complete len:1111 (-),score=323.71 TRINITY_DN1208_c0_g1_i1:84-3416(-)
MSEEQVNEKIKEKKESTQKRDELIRLEKEIAAEWEQARVWEIDAPPPGTDTPKFFATFPYPYMNGRLHLGHSFTVSKADFTVGYQSLKGKNILFPFAFHCTGMPIKACADKLKREIETYGNPPKFPPPTEEELEEIRQEELRKKEAEEQKKAAGGKQLSKKQKQQQQKDQKAQQEQQKKAAAAEKGAASPATPAATKDSTQHRSNKSKATAKKGKATYQWDIMKDMDVPESEIPKFADAYYWLEYFPPHAQTDLKKMGVRVDWRRSFITTDVNLYYDSFVRWQFRKLKELGKVKFGKRYSVYSPKDGQPCADHDRQTGEGVQPQEYTLIKQQIVWDTVSAERKQKTPEFWSKIDGKPVYLVPATLRPETMYGQTNCFVLPTGEYGAYEVGKNNEIWVMGAQAAKNLSYQGWGHNGEFGKTNCLGTIKGEGLLGIGIKAPLTKYEVIYVLPMMNISTEKGSGVVTSVPSDAPDDYAALTDLKNKDKLREKYGITKEMVDPFAVVPIINVPGYGDTCAVKACEDLKIKSQNDVELLAKAKEDTYKKGFYEGVMLVGEYAGKPVKDVKPIIRKQLIKAGQAVKYSEPEKPVTSRSGDTCVSAKTEQWYLNYGEAEWKAKVDTILKNMQTYSAETRHVFENTLAWLRQWACSRTYGLGTRLPFDEKYLIESLSDSTVYMAYYTVAHYLQSDIRGEKPGRAGFKPEELNDDIWNYIFKLSDTKPQVADEKKSEMLDKMRREFEYWYPLDLRVSGKDLIQNHLTMSLYNHAAIWPTELCPQGVRCNGFLLLNGDKMSKSTGNFLTLSNAADQYSIDGMRLALADAGDSLDDANFASQTADTAIKRLFTQLEWAREAMEILAKNEASGENYVAEGAKFHEAVFESAVNKCIADTERAYEETKFREALLNGFYALQDARDRYRLALGEKGMKRSTIVRFLEVQALLLSPICPHFCDIIWKRVLGHTDTILKQTWPKGGAVDEKLLSQNQYLHDLMYKLRARAKTNEERKLNNEECYIYVAKEVPEWKRAVVGVMKKLYRKETNDFEATLRKELSNALTAVKGVSKKEIPKMMGFGQILEENVKKNGIAALNLESVFDEREFLGEQREYVKQQLGVKDG